ncbi:uracil-DNA glycosylase [Lutimonas zeaxanthinifaciens]|uniref:uracil-DNA glycosylase n=1 Tax=Lutimonas zeaxanthinifaciens TaxID=3060215 RepID=UPI00265D1661|nr:uracil-DNA glycosylase [Lutimonas sp. YSD2104]WKK67490.1 uracil-DNA glycosylase [Lutimonas sp. YSD2104]
MGKQKVAAETTNLYRGESKSAQLRRSNLAMYLHKMERLKPTVLLLGEAPGYKGCGITGVPFTSERILAEYSIFQDQGFKIRSNILKPESEISATIVWDELERLDSIPLIWNIFPFHPHTSENKRANRTPNKAELETGKKFLLELLELFCIEKIITLGRKPESMVKELGLKHTYVRHPANGGKNKFVIGLREEMSKT